MSLKSTMTYVGASCLLLLCVIGLGGCGGGFPSPAGTSTTLQTIAVTPNQASVAAGSTLQFKATGNYSDGSTQELTTKVSWASSNTAVATIANETGLATGVAAGGPITITATSAGVTGAAQLTVTGLTPTPHLQTVNPNSGQQGQLALSVTITGQDTHFVQGVTTTNFGTGITVTSTTVNSATSATAVINIDPEATIGTRDVTMTTGSEVAVLANSFSVTAGTPVLTQVSPGSAKQGQQGLSVTITGQFTHFAQGVTTASFGSGITVTSLTVSSATTAIALINIDPTAATGTRTLTVTTNTKIVTLSNAFSITAGTPVITNINPRCGQAGQSLTVTITGQYTHFAQGKTTADFGAGIIVTSLVVNSATNLTALIDIDPVARIAIEPVAIVSRNVTITTTDAETVTSLNGFCIASPPLITLNPNTGQQGQQGLSVTITGQNTHFDQGVAAPNFGPGITVTSMKVNSATNATAVINIDSTAPTGGHTVTVISNGEPVSLPNGFFVSPGTPVLTRINPNSGQAGQPTNLVITITGQYTHFVQGKTSVSLGAGIAILSVTVNSPTSLTAVITISFAAAPGPRDVTVTTNTETVVLPNGFTINAPPILSQVAPNTGQQGQQRLSVAITAQYTHFLHGATSANFGSGITTISVTVTSPTTATAVINIDPGATTGARNLTVKTNSEVETLNNAFNVTAGSPALIKVDPSSGVQGQENLSVALTGDFTHWKLGTSKADFGTGITVVSLTVNSPTDATAVLNVGGPPPVEVLPSDPGQVAQGYAVSDFATGFANASSIGPIGLAFDQLGTLFVMDLSTGFLYKFGPAGGVASPATQVNATAISGAPAGMTFGRDGSLFLAQQGTGNIVQLDPSSGAIIRTVATGLATPTSLATDPLSGDLFVSAEGTNSVMRISQFASGPGTVSIYASPGLTDGIYFGPDGTLYGALLTSGEVAEISGTNSTAPGTVTVLPVNVPRIDGLAISADPKAQFLYGNRNDGIITKIDLTVSPPALTNIFTGGSRGDFTTVGPDGCLYATQTDRVLKVTNSDGTCIPPPLGPLYPSNPASVVAVPGPRTVTVRTNAEVVSLANSFTVIAAPVPTLTQVSPGTGQQAQRNLSITITGQNTGFIQGKTLASFGPGISVGGAASGAFGPVTVAGPTSIIAQLSIDASAATGSRPVTVSIGTQSLLLSNGFTVNAGTNHAPVVSAGPDQTVAQSWQFLVSSNDWFDRDTNESVLRFDGTSGSFLGAVTPITGAANGISYPFKLSVDTSDRLYVSVISSQNRDVGGIYRFNLESGTFLDAFVPLGENGPSEALSFALGPDGNFYLANHFQPNIKRYNGVTGQFLDVFATEPPQIIGLGDVTFGPDNNLYAASGATNSSQILKFDGGTGAFLGVFASCPTNGDFTAAGILFGSDGNLYVAGLDAAEVLRFNGKTGGLIDTFVPSHSGGLVRADYLAFGPDGNLYVGDLPAGKDTGQVLRYNGLTGAFIDAFIPPGTGGLLRAAGLLFHLNGSPANLSGTVTDDGLPVPTMLTSTWSMVSGPGVVTFGNVNSPSTTATFNKPGTYVLRLTASDGQLSSSSDTTVTVNTVPAAPPTSISSVAPASGQQGQTDLSVTITGQHTTWSQSTTNASFGAGITVSSLTVNSATSATAKINIDPAASVGPRTVTLKTGTESESLQNGFSVTPAQAPLVNAGSDQTLTSGWDLLAGNYIRFTPTKPLGRILRYDGSTGAFIDVFAAQGTGGLDITAVMSLGPDLNLYVNNGSSPPNTSDVLKFDSNTAQFISQVTPVGDGGTFTFGPDGTLYTVDGYTDRVVKRFDPKTGAFLGVFSGAMDFPRGMAFGPDGNLYVGNNNTVTKIDGQTGTILGPFITPGAGGLSEAGDIIFGPDGNLYVVEFLNFNILRYDGKTGAFKDVFIPSGRGGMQRPYPIAFGPDGYFYLGTNPTDNTGGIYRYDGQTGAFIDNFVPNGSGGITDTLGFVFRSAELTAHLSGTSSSFLPLTISWSEVSGPGTATFANPNALQTTATFDQFGTYVLRLTASNSAGNSDADVSITVLPSGNKAPMVSAGPSESGSVHTPIVLAGSVSDDGLPSPKVLLVNWSEVSGPGIATFANPHAGPTSATFDTPGQYTLRLTANDGELSSTAYTTVVVTSTQGPTPAISSVAPASGVQGQTNLSVAITGQNTNWAQGTTIASFGAGVTVQSLTVSSPTNAVALLNIDPAAPVGPTIVTMTTGGEIERLVNGFSVTSSAPGQPAIVIVSPSSGPQGQSGPIGIEGQNTHWAQGITSVDFGPGITVSNISVGCSTCLTATLAIDPAASLGPRTVTVTTGSEIVTLVNGFTVTASGTGPILTSITPINVHQGHALSVAITGANTHFAQGQTQVSFGSGVTTKAVSVSSATSLSAQIQVDPSAVPGTRTVSVTTGNEVESVANVFNVLAGSPVISSLNPGGAQQGAQGVSVAITGQFTHFVQGSSQVTFAAGITVTNVAVSSPTSLTAQINIASNAPIGAGTVTVTTTGEVASFPNGFTLTAPTPILFTIDPGGGGQGQKNLSVALTGQFTNWAQGKSTVSFGSGITLVSLAITSATTATAVVNIDPAATIGSRTVTVTTGAEVDSFPGGFSVVPGTPALLSANPNSGQPGQQGLSIVLKGQNTNWVPGTTTVNFGAGITVISLTVNSSTSATAIANIESTATPGPRTITVTTGSEIETLSNGFTVGNGTPVLLSAFPASGKQGQQNISVVLTGQFTHFVQEATQVQFASGITVTGITVSSSSSVTAKINIADDAPIGPGSITITTNNELVVLHNGFTVTAAISPTIRSITPASGLQGHTLSVVITGQNTHFAPGSTQVSVGSDISVDSLTVTSATSLKAQLTIGSTASLSPRDVTVSTGLEQATLPNGFTVQQANAPFTLSPNTALQGQTVSVTITTSATQFAPGTTVARFGSGIMVGNGIAGDFGPITVTSPNTAIAQITVIATSNPGPRTVTVQIGDQQIMGINIFDVVGSPILSSISPGSALQGQSGTAVITGVFTNFVQGTTQVSLGPGISVGGAPEGSFGPATINSPTSATVQLSVDSAAALGLRTVTVQTGTEQASSINGFSVLAPGTGPGPLVAFTSPSEGSEVTSPTAVTGTVTSSNLDYWTLEYQAIGSVAFTEFASGTSASVSGTLDPTLLLNGNTIIRLTAIDTFGQTASTTLNVVVARNQKIGNFTVSFNDLTVPVEGLPIQVVRTYDSRNQQVGDFGVGWTLDLKNVIVSSNGPLGLNWTGTSSGGFLPQYCVEAVQSHVVTISLTDGTTYEFQPVLGGQCQQIVPPSQVTIGFVPIGSTPQNAALAVLGNNQPYVLGTFPGPMSLLNLDDVTTFDPDQYILTLPDGRTLQISRQVGLQSMTDLNGNTLTVTPNGITHSSGKDVAFTRDNLGRITQITDPVGNVLTYEYDSNGNLVTFTDAANNTSSYGYNGNHGLTTIIDPRGVQPIRNDYDDTGRLVSHTDAFGQVINYTYDPGTQQEIVTDRLGNVTVNEYDADGNIVKVTDAAGGITTRTYDSSDNLVTETNPLKETRSYTYDGNKNRLTEKDPLGQTTTYTYNERNQVLTTTDPLNHITTNIYDANGNLLSTTDAANNVTSYTYNAQGLRMSMTDPLGDVTNYQYDSFGNLSQQTDPLGNMTSYTYDRNGNKRSETRTRTSDAGQVTMVTNYQYDQQNRLVQTTYPDGSTTQIQYDAIGKQSVTTDQLGRQTSYQYDLMGRLTQTAYPDGTSESSTYDAEGDRVTSTDRGSRTTTFAYDHLKRLFKTTYADGASTSTDYDAAGQVMSVTDPLGNETQYQYDADGHRTEVVDALGHSTSFGYDNDGNQSSIKDANGNTTQYKYDALNRRTAVIYPDTTSDLTTYDALGRTVSKTDEAGKVTQFQYDRDGRLVQVIDALGQKTGYAYDEVGNRISQTDANKHTTAFSYDNFGRRVKRTLPLGMSESYTYDAAGNLKAKTDFNGKTTTYNYDEANRLTTKSPDPSFNEPTISFTYTMSGQRQSMSDASGTTSYTYDPRDRLTQKATPEGTLHYVYDLAGNLTSIRSSNTGGTSVSYAYDQLNRLANVVDNRQASQTTTYVYDKVGNLKSYVYPNGVTTALQYNSLNRLTDLAIGKTSMLAGYSYTLGPTGNRTAVFEISSRQINYTYDNLYRLTRETISGNTSDPSANGTISYVYDPVGNRRSRSSTIAAVPPASYSYDANDRLMTDSYDANGSTTASNGNSYAYDFENHLISQNGSTAVTIVYDGDGNRVSETAGKTTTQYLIDDRNPTGYAQVLEELSGGAVQRVYTYGSSRISQTESSGSSFYESDGQGNVRLLTDSAGTVTDRYDYDAFGNITSRTGTTQNVYLYSGEQRTFDGEFYYLRARYFNNVLGRFWTADTFEGDSTEPLSLHAYAYAENGPVDKKDPTGRSVFVGVRPLDLGVMGFLARPVANHIFLAFRSPNGLQTFSFHPKQECDGRTSASLQFGFFDGLAVVLAGNTPCIKYNANEDLAVFDIQGGGAAAIGYGLYQVSASSSKESELLQDALIAKDAINSGNYGVRNYSGSMYNCGSWVSSMLEKEGLHMPGLINLGIGTTFRLGLAPHLGVSVTYRFDSLSDFAALFSSLR